MLEMTQELGRSKMQSPSPTFHCEKIGANTGRRGGNESTETCRDETKTPVFIKGLREMVASIISYSKR